MTGIDFREIEIQYTRPFVRLTNFYRNSLIGIIIYGCHDFAYKYLILINSFFIPFHLIKNKEKYIEINEKIQTFLAKLILSLFEF